MPESDRSPKEYPVRLHRFGDQGELPVKMVAFGLQIII
ncbi:unnamed protein product [Acidithrix sp. C25]|nr:unnamed protein product [Acidithrix sp. C25]